MSTVAMRPPLAAFHCKTMSFTRGSFHSCHSHYRSNENLIILPSHFQPVKVGKHKEISLQQFLRQNQENPGSLRTSIHVQRAIPSFDFRTQRQQLRWGWEKSQLNGSDSEKIQIIETLVRMGKERNQSALDFHSIYFTGKNPVLSCHFVGSFFTKGFKKK